MGRVVGVFSVTVGETFPNTLPNDAALLEMSIPLAIPDVGQVAQAAIEEAAVLTSTPEAFRKGKCEVSE